MLQKCSLWRVATVFFDKPERKFELMEISRKINLAHTSVKKHLTTLIDLQLIECTTADFGDKPAKIYKAKKNNHSYKLYKILYNIHSIKSSGLIEYINDTCQPNCIVLFGSFQKGEDTSNSDIDLFIESKDAQIDLNLYKKKLNRTIQLHFKNKFTDFPQELKDNIINGYVLSGYLEAYDA